MILLTSCPSSAAPACRSMPCEHDARCHARPFALRLLPEWPQRVPRPPRDALPRQPKGARCASHSGTRGPSVRGAAASCAFCPRIRSITSRAFCGDIRTCRARACASIDAFCVCTSAMTYAFGAGAAPPPAGAPGAAPPAGATPAAFSSAAFTPWPLNDRVGANSPSLCPIICSVTYTGMNFFPLCTAMVCPIMSGTIVERRDQVLITFFSLRVFSPSTFSRRWPSTNGPFFSERAIDPLFLHSPQPAPLSPPHLLEAPHRPGNAVRLRAEGADKPRALRICNALHNDCPARLAQLVQNRLRGSRRHLDYRAHRFHALRDCPLHRPAASSCCSCCSCRSHWFCSHRAVFSAPPGFSPQETSNFLTSGARQCSCRCACCSSSSCPASGRPKASADDCPLPCLRRRRADDPRGSWPRRVPSA